VHAADAVVDGSDVVVSWSSEDVTHHLGSEAVVTEEDVADAG
jgi:outer membrane receptor for Fe3+-dicitrate